MLHRAIYLFLDDFGGLSVCPFGCSLSGSGACETSLWVTPGSRFMILLPGGGSLLEIQLTLGAFVKVVVLGLALRNDSETKKKGKTKCKVQSHTSPRVSDP